MNALSANQLYITPSHISICPFGQADRAEVQLLKLGTKSRNRRALQPSIMINDRAIPVRWIA